MCPGRAGAAGSRHPRGGRSRGGSDHLPCVGQGRRRVCHPPEDRGGQGDRAGISEQPQRLVHSEREWQCVAQRPG